MAALVLVILAVLMFGVGFAVNVLWLGAVLILGIAAVSYMRGGGRSRRI